MRIPRPAYQAFATIMGFPGSDGLRGIHDEAFPVQDLSRMLLDTRVKRTLYTFTNNPAATGDVLFQWRDLSDFTEVRINGALVGSDAELPQPSEERIIVGLGLEVTGNAAHYTSAELTRQMPNVAESHVELVTFGAITTGHFAPAQRAPLLYPVTLNIGEENCNARMVVTGTAAVFEFTIFMLAAERGVMNLYPGV